MSKDIVKKLIKWFTSSYIPTMYSKTKFNLTWISDISIQHLYLTFIFDIYIWHLYLTLQLIFDIYIWHFYLTFISDIYIWQLHLTFYVREKHVICLCELGKCPNPLFYRCKFLERLNHYINFDFSGKTRTKTRASEGYWRLPSPPIVGEKHVHFLM